MLSLVDDLDRVCTFGNLLQGLAASRTPLLVALNSLAWGPYGAGCSQCPRTFWDFQTCIQHVSVPPDFTKNAARTGMYNEI